MTPPDGVSLGTVRSPLRLRFRAFTDDFRMTEELTKTEARQGDRRRTNLTALFVGTALALVLLGLLVLLWA